MNFLRQHSKCIFLAALLLLCSLNSQASTDDGKAIALAKQNACLGCHAVDKKIVGPSLQAIAKKYTNDPNARTFLKNKILKGGSGSWGVVPMPANARLSDAEVSLLVGWILRGAPSTN
jgi:cytochrome c